MEAQQEKVMSSNAHLQGAHYFNLSGDSHWDLEKNLSEVPPHLTLFPFA